MAHVLTNGTTATFDPSRLEGGSYTLSVTVTDSGNPPISVEKALIVVIPAAPAEENGSTGAENRGSGKKSGKGGSMPWLMLLSMAGLMAWRRRAAN